MPGQAVMPMMQSMPISVGGMPFLPNMVMMPGGVISRPIMLPAGVQGMPGIQGMQGAIHMGASLPPGSGQSPFVITSTATLPPVGQVSLGDAGSLRMSAAQPSAASVPMSYQVGGTIPLKRALLPAAAPGGDDAPSVPAGHAGPALDDAAEPGPGRDAAQQRHLRTGWLASVMRMGSCSGNGRRGLQRYQLLHGRSVALAVRFMSLAGNVVEGRMFLTQARAHALPSLSSPPIL